MTSLMKRIFRRRAADESPGGGVANLFRGRARGERLPGYKRLPSLGLARLRGRLPWTAPAPPAPAPADATQQTELIDAAAAPPPSFKDRSRLRRRLRFLRRTRELGFRDVGGLIFDMRRFTRNRPDLLDAKLDALLAVDQELRALERILDDRRPIHELREPGISACARCGALHASDSNFCPECGLQLSGPRAMGELGGAIAAPPKPPPVPSEPVWSWPSAPSIDRRPATTTVMQPEPAPDQPTQPTVVQPEPDQPTISYTQALPHAEPGRPPPVRDLSADELPGYAPGEDGASDDPEAPSERAGETHAPPPEPDDGAKAPVAAAEDEPEAAPLKPAVEARRRRFSRRSASRPEPESADKLTPGEEPTQTSLPPASDGS